MRSHPPPSPLSLSGAGSSAHLDDRIGSGLAGRERPSYRALSAGLLTRAGARASGRTVPEAEIALHRRRPIRHRLFAMKTPTGLKAMKHSKLTDAERNEFLAETRVATLSWLTRFGAPISAPVWFQWDGTRAHMFSAKDATKVRCLKRDPRASLLVCRPAGEREEWVAIDGRVVIGGQGGFELAERSAQRYWDLTDDYYSKALDGWRESPESFIELKLIPAKIRTYVTR